MLWAVNVSIGPNPLLLFEVPLSPRESHGVVGRTNQERRAAKGRLTDESAPFDSSPRCPRAAPSRLGNPAWPSVVDSPGLPPCRPALPTGASLASTLIANRSPHSTREQTAQRPSFVNLTSGTDSAMN